MTEHQTAHPTATSLDVRARIGQLNQRLKGWEAVRWVDGRPRITDVLRAEVDRWGGIGAVYGVLRADPWSGVHWGNGIPPERSAEAYAAVQDHVVAHSDGGVPTLFVEEVPHGLQALGGTTVPVNLALGAAMDEQLVEDLAAAVAAEVRARGTHVALVSGLDVLRDPRWGRSEECWSEDAALAAIMVAATVRGMQGGGPGPIDDRHVAVVAKHLAGQGAGIGGRNGSGAPIGRRELAEVHLPPALAAAREHVAGFMAAYNDVDGVPCCGNRDLLTTTIRDTWGWDGLVMADGTAIDRLRDVTPDPASAAALALRAGVDLSLWDESYTHLDGALDRGLISTGDLDRAVDRVLALKRRVGLLATPTAPPATPAPAPAPGPAENAEPPERATIALAERAAHRAVVALGGALPAIAPDAVVAVVGPNADDVDALLGDYSPPRPPVDPGASTVRSALEARLGPARIRTARGSGLRQPLPGPDGLLAVRTALLGADVAVVVLGGSSRRAYDDGFEDNGAVSGPAPDTTNGEGVDLASIAVPDAQLDVLRAARESGLPVVAVVVDGRPRVLSEVLALADSVLVVPFPGPSGGRAVADVLFGAPAEGRLPATWPGADGVLPVAHDERLETARGYVDVTSRSTVTGAPGPGGGVDVRLAEGSDAVTAVRLLAGGTVTVPVTVRNTSDAPRRVSVPLWGRRREPGVRPRRRRLLALVTVDVPAGGTVDTAYALGLDALGTWDAGLRLGARPLELDCWTDDVLDPPGSTRTVRVTDGQESVRWVS
ncbi:beta-glucosidase [Curtobacterium sp. PhB25]|uniref:glycoside hydrolase family 3 protein n=1 Tax=unclassified Curtobacterium TaxID=257496 RepID=UPI00104C8FD6|nr:MULTISPECIES: glycoside hydrolase family 3 N-terminal domain-containing protein [unclassified Curtobacterium]TCU83554.1 beta-glucosidase [Curtobacterium sp. PhB191]TDW44443.1 beta-glucosidase [Curtobacterium sp. PhB42]TDW54144.1 beta-glucosidase [Curtobacterium sp. PhB190]TDW67048.1 beta-glucosidase [Curtobacterium sp. PhB25]